MSKKKSKMHNVNKQSKKDLNTMKLDTKKIQMNLPGLNRNDGIVKSGTGTWENKKRKNINKQHKKEISEHKGSSDISFFLQKIGI